MIIRVLITFGFLGATTVYANVLVKAGTKPAGEPCFAPIECREPLYCLRKNERYQCSQKLCRGQDECRIGQFCGKSGFCEATNCETDDQCAGDTVCTVSGKCGSKSNPGQRCNRDLQCWSSKCLNGKCIAPNSADKPQKEDSEAFPNEGIAESEGGEGGQDTEKDQKESEEDLEDENNADIEDNKESDNSEAGESRRKLGGGAIVGIVLGILLLLALIFLCVLALIKLGEEKETSKGRV